MSEVNNISILNLSYVREVDNNNLLSGELDNLSNLPHLTPLLSRRGNIMIIYFLWLLLPFTSHATCTPTPDCASIGYTETSCETDYLACPFDSTKLKCIPCDSSFRYECSGDNITGGTGSTCGGKYAQCKCSSTDYIFSNGSCICDTSCKVGAIYYSDGTCSACVDNAKTPSGVVVKDNELVMSQNSPNEIPWGENGYDISDLNNMSSDSIAKTDFNGRENTLTLVNTQTSTGLTSSDSGAIYCNEYSIEGTKAGDWYLPAAGELYSYVYANLTTLNATVAKLGWTFESSWSSTESSYNAAWALDYYYVWKLKDYFKYAKNHITCFLSIN